jgi:hypothetical protein
MSKLCSIATKRERKIWEDKNIRFLFLEIKNQNSLQFVRQKTYLIFFEYQLTYQIILFYKNMCMK